MAALLRHPTGSLRLASERAALGGDAAGDVEAGTEAVGWLQRAAGSGGSPRRGLGVLAAPGLSITLCKPGDSGGTEEGVGGTAADCGSAGMASTGGACGALHRRTLAHDAGSVSLGLLLLSPCSWAWPWPRPEAPLLAPAAAGPSPPEARTEKDDRLLPLQRPRGPAPAPCAVPAAVAAAAASSRACTCACAWACRSPLGRPCFPPPMLLLQLDMSYSGLLRCCCWCSSSPVADDVLSYSTTSGAADAPPVESSGSGRAQRALGAASRGAVMDGRGERVVVLLLLMLLGMEPAAVRGASPGNTPVAAG